SPLGALATAAGLAALVWALPGRGARPAPAEAASRQFQFVVVAPRATRVALVGDFNDWDATRTPMRPSPRGGSVWTAVLPLSPGRYRYAFLVDGSRWLADPAARAESITPATRGRAVASRRPSRGSCATAVAASSAASAPAAARDRGITSHPR